MVLSRAIVLTIPISRVFLIESGWETLSAENMALANHAPRLGDGSCRVNH